MNFDELKQSLIEKAEAFQFVFLPDDAKPFTEMCATLPKDLLEDIKADIREAYIENAQKFTKKEFSEKIPNADFNVLEQEFIRDMHATQQNEMLRRLFEKTNTERLRLECRVLCTGAGMSENDFIEYFNYYLHTTGNAELVAYI